MSTKTDTKKKNLETFRNVCEVTKESFITDFVQAMAQGTIAVEEQERLRVVALITNLFDLHNANGYEKFQTLLK